MVYGLSFRLLYRVALFCFCFIFACSYHHGGGSGYDNWEDKTELNKLKNEFNGEHLNDDVFLKQDECAPNLTENTKQVDGGEAWKKVIRSKTVRKGKF